MKICIDLTALADHFSGVERFASSATKAIIQKNKVLCILLFKGSVHSDFQEFAQNPKVRMVVLPAGKSKVLFNQITLPRAVWCIKADAYLFPAFPMPLWVRRKNCFTVIHDTACFDLPDTMRPLQRAYYKISRYHEARYAKQVLTISEFSKERILHRLPLKNKMVVNVSCGVEQQFLKYQKKEEECIRIQKKYNLPAKYILSLSTLEPRKNLKALLLAYDALLQEGYDLPVLVLAGRRGWKMDDFLEGVSEKTRKKIVITGFVEEEDLPALYGGAALFVFPSLYEGFGIPPLEALACQTPVISSNADTLQEVLKDAPVYFSLSEKESLKSTIINVLGMTETEKEAYIRRGEALAKEYTFQKTAGKILCAIKQARDSAVKVR